MATNSDRMPSVGPSGESAFEALLYAQEIVATLREPFLILDEHLRVRTANAAFYRAFQVPEGETSGRFIYELGNGQWDIPDLRTLLEQAIPREIAVNDYEVEHDFPVIGKRSMRLNARRFPPDGGHPSLIMLALEDVTERKRSESIVLDSEARYRALLESAPDAIVIVNERGEIVLANALAEKLFGYGRAELLGRPVETLMPDRFHESHIQHREDYIRRPHPRGMDGGIGLMGRRKDGSEFPIEVSLSPIETDQGMLVSSAIRDVTERRKSEAALLNSELRFRRLFQTAKDGILILDVTNGTIIEANPFMCGLLGYEIDDFLGKELWEIGLFEDKAANQAAYSVLREKGYIRYEHLPLKTKGGDEVEVEFVSNLYTVGEHQVAQCNIRDITERSRMERQAKAQALALADLHRRKDEFLAMLSHELRNPISPILNAVHLLRLQGDENLIQKEARVIIERQVGQLAHLVDDLLEVARFTSGKVRLYPARLDMRNVVERAVESARPLIDSRRHTLMVSLPEEPIWLNADPTRMEQVVVNLLNNAAKYTDEGGRIWVAVVSLTREMLLTVRDSGIGIDLDKFPDIFDLFTQADRSLARSQGGLGIGLSLVQRLVELHGGTVEVRSDGLGLGSEFTVRLPLSGSISDSPPEPVQSADRPAHAGRVLVVDDNVDSADILAKLLRRSGHDVWTAYGGPEALEAAVAHLPDIVLLDIGLPGLNGYEVARRLRQFPQLEGVKLVAMTGYGQDSDLQLAREAGFDLHLVKPVDFVKVRAIIATLLTPPVSDS